MTHIFLSVLGISLSAGAFAALLILCAPLLNRRYAARWRYGAWIFLALWLLIPVTGLDGQTIAGLLPSGADASQAAETVAPLRRITIEIPRGTPATAKTGEAPARDLAPLDIAAFVWAAACLAIILFTLISYMCFVISVYKRGNILRDDAWIRRQISAQAREFHIKRAVTAVIYPAADSPMIIGFFRPVLILPDMAYSEKELFYIIKHELIHVKRGDVYFKLLFTVVRAVHWFNPLIWLMHREASIDMEIACDETVTRQFDFAEKKAYSETLLTTIRRQRAKSTVLSTQFYGGKEIMKKRFKNILSKKEKKSGVSIFVLTAATAVCLGALVGCSTSAGTNAGDPAQTQSQTGDAKTSDAETSDDEATNTPENEATEAPEAEATKMLTFSKEGEEEQKKAVLSVGDGFSFYLPEGEWEQAKPDQWVSTANKKVRLWAKCFKGESKNKVEKKLTAQGYETTAKKLTCAKKQTKIACLYKSGNDTWGVFYCYPREAEEGYGAELSVIADTFAVTE